MAFDTKNDEDPIGKSAVFSNRMNILVVQSCSHTDSSWIRLILPESTASVMLPFCGRMLSLVLDKSHDCSSMTKIYYYLFQDIVFSHLRYSHTSKCLPRSVRS